MFVQVFGKHLQIVVNMAIHIVWFVLFSDANKTTGDPTRMYETLDEMSGDSPYEISGIIIIKPYMFVVISS